MSLIKLLLFVLVGALTLEIAARTEDFLRWDASPFRSYDISNLQYADELGRRCRPDGQYKHFVLDSDGFRKTPSDNQNLPAAYLFGASEAFGLYEKPAQEFAAQLETRLQVGGKPWNIVNAACIGMSTPHVIRYIKERAHDLPLDRILYYPTPHFYLDNARPVAKAIAAESVDAPEGRVVHSRFVAKFSSVLKTFLPSTLQDWLRSLSISRENSSHDVDWIWQAPPEDRLAAFESDLVELVKVVKETNAELILMTHANAFAASEVNQSQLNAWRRFYPRAGGRTLIDFDKRANEVIRKIARQQGITLVDLGNSITAEDAFADFSHFTDTGSREVARQLERVF